MRSWASGCARRRPRFRARTSPGRSRPSARMSPGSSRGRRGVRYRPRLLRRVRDRPRGPPGPQAGAASASSRPRPCPARRPPPCRPSATTRTAAGAARAGHRRVRRRRHVRRADRQGPRCRGHRASAARPRSDLVRAIGADHVIDYTREDSGRRRARYDVIIDIGGNRPARAACAGPWPRRARWSSPVARTAAAGSAGSAATSGRTLLSPLREPEADRVRRAPAPRRSDHPPGPGRSGAITPAIDRTYPLSQAAAAVRHLAEGRVRGKVVISPEEETAPGGN